MSKFAAYLKELLSQRGEPISQLARRAGLERTSIHKALKDERLLSYAALRQLTRAMQLTLPQIRELNQYYEILLQGEEEYQMQEAICALLSELSHLRLEDGPGARPLSELPLPEQDSLISGKSLVEQAVRAVLYRETRVPGAKLCLSLPPGASLPEELRNLWEAGRDFTVCQLVAFLPNHTGKGTKLSNLNLLRQIIPLALQSRARYHASCYFEDSASGTSLDPLPYYILTPRYLIRVNESCSYGEIRQDAGMLSLYQRHFTRMMDECQPLTIYSSDTRDVLQDCITNTDDAGCFILMSQPCLGHYYTRERIERQFRPDVPRREELIALSDQRFSKLRSLSHNYYTVFSETGLRQFAQTGVFADIPQDLVLPADEALRRDLLQELRRDIAEGTVTGCIAESGRLDIPDYLTLSADSRFGLRLYAIQGFPGGIYSCGLQIQDPDIGQSFATFLKSLPEGRLVYPRERTLALLDELTASLSARCAEAPEGETT